MPIEWRMKISESLKGNKHTLGFHPSLETREKLREALKGRTISAEIRRKMSEGKRGKSNILIKGEKNPAWKGGKMKDYPAYERVRMSFEYVQWRMKCFLRDNFTCQKCGDNSGGNLHVHHIKPFSELLKEVKEYMPLLPLYESALLYTPLWNLSNGITLCKKCHGIGHYGD